MKFSNIVPKKLFKHKKSRSISRSETDPFSSSSSSSEDGLKKPNGSSTPTSVLPSSSSSAEEGAPEISAAFYPELKQAFEIIDGEGGIKAEEVEVLMRRLGAEPPSEEELKLIGSATAPPCDDGELREAFDFFDADRDGRITAEELLSVFEMIGDARCTLEDCRWMIRGVDSGGDGFVCFEDFRRMMMLQQT